MSSARAKPEPKHVLHEAAVLIYGERKDDYGSAEESFARIWVGWEQIMASDIPGPEKVALAMDWLKTCRYLAGRQRDSIVDKAGYTGLVGVIRGWE